MESRVFESEGSRVEGVVALGRALSDPIRAKMLGMLAAEANEGRGCRGLPDLGAPVRDGEEEENPPESASASSPRSTR